MAGTLSVCWQCIPSVLCSDRNRFYLLAESQPYQDLEQGAVGGEAGDGHGMAGLRLDDDTEFPPMTHKND